MLRQSFGLLSRTAAARSSAAAAAASSSSSRTPAALRLVARQYSEAASQAEGASSVQPGQEAEAAANTKANQAKGSKDQSSGKGTQELQEALDAKDHEIAKLKDSWLRSVADFENLQKITTREKTKAKEYAIESFAKDLIENMDILHLALNTVPADKRTKAARPSSSESGPTEADHLADLFVGVDMTAKNLEKTLSRFGVKAFDPTGEKFDPNLHEAMYQAPVPGKEPGSVLECQKKGWLLKDRLLRPAQVGVVMDTSN